MPTFSDWVADDIATAAELDGTESAVVIQGGLPVEVTAGKLAQSPRAVNTQTGDYTLVLTDAGKRVAMNKATAVALTVPPNASVAFPVGTRIPVYNAGAGVVTFTPGAAVTLRGTLTLAQYGFVELIKLATNEWVVAGGNASSVEIGVALSDETTDLTTGNGKATIRMPFAMTVTAVRASVNTVSSSGVVTVDINDDGGTILSTKLTIDASEKTSVTAATPAVISDTALADDAEVTFDIDTAGTGAKGLKVWIYGTRP